MDYLTNDTDIKKVADAIRAKGGTSAPLAYPTGFVSAIQAIQTGITPQLAVTTSAGASVTAKKGSKTISGTAGADGVCTLEIPEAGEWSVTVSKSGLSMTQSIVIGKQDMVLYPEPDAAFADNTWERIIMACQAGVVPSTWSVGDSKTMTIDGTDYQVDIIGKDHDDYADGSGKAPLTFQLHDCYGTYYAMHTSATTRTEWSNTAMRQTHLPAILALMPESVRDGIRAVTKKTDSAYSYGSSVTTEDKLFCLSKYEVFGVGSTWVADESQYAYYSAGNSKIKKYKGTSNAWWCRTPIWATDSPYYFVRVSATGAATQFRPDTALGVAFAFCF